jgi:hypothetical protein
MPYYGGTVQNPACHSIWCVVPLPVWHVMHAMCWALSSTTYRAVCRARFWQNKLQQPGNNTDHHAICCGSRAAAAELRQQSCGSSERLVMSGCPLQCRTDELHHKTKLKPMRAS